MTRESAPAENAPAFRPVGFREGKLSPGSFRARRDVATRSELKKLQESQEFKLLVASRPRPGRSSQIWAGIAVVTLLACGGVGFALWPRSQSAGAQMMVNTTSPVQDMAAPVEDIAALTKQAVKGEETPMPDLILALAKQEQEFNKAAVQFQQDRTLLEHTLFALQQEMEVVSSKEQAAQMTAEADRQTTELQKVYATVAGLAWFCTVLLLVLLYVVQSRRLKESDYQRLVLNKTKSEIQTEVKMLKIRMAEYAKTAKEADKAAVVAGTWTDVANARCDQLDDQLDHARQMYTEACAEAKRAQAEHDQHQHETVVQHDAKLQELTKVNDEKAANQKLLNTVQMEKSANQELQETVQSEKAANQKLQETVQSANQKLHETVQNENAAKQELHETVQSEKAACQKLQETVQSEKAANQKLQETVQNEKAASQKLLETVQNEKAANQKLHEEAFELQQKLEKAEQAVKDTESAAQELNEKVYQLQAELEGAEKAVKDGEATSNELDAKVAELEHWKKIAEKTAETQEVVITRLQKKFSKAAARNKQLETDLENAKTNALYKIGAVMDLLKTTKLSLSQKLDASRKEVASLRKQLAKTIEAPDTPGSAQYY